MKIFADFESVLKKVQRIKRDDNASYTKKNLEDIPCSFAHKFVCIDDRFSSPADLERGKNVVNRFIAAILK